MTATDFLKQLRSISLDSRAAFSASVISLPKLAAAEAVAAMLKDSDFGVRINAIKAIRKFELDIYEKELILLLIDPEDEVRVAALKSLCSFGKSEHFKLAKAFYEENSSLRHLVIDSFVNFSDLYDAHLFIFNQLDSTNEKIRQNAEEWFEKMLGKDIFQPWIADIYEESPWSLRLIFEEIFSHRLNLLFNNAKYGYRFKLLYLIKRGKLEL
ncbi:hypothetical protein AGMMS50229_07530 [Campylobacterota bacterium]|nr:hypothetical protein AGMMS50229_07530 [Campylobacterota bacterium]